MEFVQNVKDDVRNAIRKQVVHAHETGLSPRELASNLYWMKDEVPELKKYNAQTLLRDYQRVATTELAMIHSSGKMAQYEGQARESLEEPEKAVHMIFTGGTCEWCQAHHGTIVRLVPADMVAGNDDSLKSMGIEDTYTNIAVWPGKNNVGFKQKAWRVCTPAHPWNTAQLVRFHPEAQEYNEKTGNGDNLMQQIQSRISGD